MNNTERLLAIEREASILSCKTGNFCKCDRKLTETRDQVKVTLGSNTKRLGDALHS